MERKSKYIPFTIRSSLASYAKFLTEGDFQEFGNKELSLMILSKT
jgi:hypothetical protein